MYCVVFEVNMLRITHSLANHLQLGRGRMYRWLCAVLAASLVASLVACGTGPARRAAPDTSPPSAPVPIATTGAISVTPLPPARASGALAGMSNTPSPQQAYRSRWVSASWNDLPGWQNDGLHDAWNAWLQNCERPGPLFAPLCKDVRQLILASDDDRRLWMMAHLQPYRVESLDGNAEGLLTSYYEPLFDASTTQRPGFEVPLYAPPDGLAQLRNAGRAWFTRQEIDTLPAAQNALNGKAIAWLADPIDAMVLHIQGSGRLRITEANGQLRTVRIAYAANNEQPYQSIGRWLLDKGELKDASWPGIKAWLQRNPQRAQALLWQNPRYVFFREEALPDPLVGPRGAQGLPLTAGRSIAVDPQSIPYGSPLWLVSPGPTQALQRLVVAQDTGSAIVGAVRADWFAGTGLAAGELAGRIKQPLRMWVLWPK